MTELPFYHKPQIHSVELKSRAIIKHEMRICSNQEGMIPGLLPHLVCNWLCSCKDDAEGLEDCWRLSSYHPSWWGLWGKPASKTSQHGLQCGICLLSHPFGVILYNSLFLVDSLFVMNINIGQCLPDAASVRGSRRGHDWNSGEASGSNLDQGMQERGNGFRLLLFALALRFM